MKRKIIRSLISLISCLSLIIIYIGATTTTAYANNIYYNNKHQYANWDFVKSSLSCSDNDMRLVKGESTTLNLNITGEAYIPDSLLQKPKAIVIVADESGSMAWGNYDGYDGDPSRIDVLKGALNNMINEFSSKTYNTSMCIVPYSYEANKVGTGYMGKFFDAKTQTNELRQAVYQLNSEGSTNIGDGLRRAYYLLSSISGDIDKYVILLTDGVANQITYNDYYNYYIKYSDGTAQYINPVQDEAKGVYYACEMGRMISSNTNATSFVVGITRGADGSKLQQIGTSLNSVIAPNGLRYFMAERIDGDSGIASVLQQITKMIDSIQITNVVVRQPLPQNVILDISSLPYGVSYNPYSKIIYTSPFNLRFIKDPDILPGTTDVHKYTLDPSSNPYPYGLNLRIISNTYSSFAIKDGTIEYRDVFLNSHLFFINSLEFKNTSPINGFNLIDNSTNKVIPNNGTIYIPYDTSNGKTSNSVTVNLLSEHPQTQQELLDMLKEYYINNPNGKPAAINFKLIPNSNELSLSTNKPEHFTVTDKATLDDLKYTINVTKLDSPLVAEASLKVSITGDHDIVTPEANIERTYKIIVVRKTDLALSPINSLGVGDKKIIKVLANGYEISESNIKIIDSSFEWNAASGNQIISITPNINNPSQAIITGCMKGKAIIKVVVKGRIVDPSTTCGFKEITQALDVYVDIG